MNPNDVHTAGNAVPSVDGTDLGDILADLTTAPSHPAIQMLCDAVRLLAHDRLTIGQTQVILAELCGSPDGTDVIGMFAHLQARLTSPDTNPCLRALPMDAQKQAELQGHMAAFHLTDPELRDNTARANAALDQ